MRYTTIIISFIVAFLVAFCSPAAAQYAPQQGVAGSTAISAADPQFTLWASGCVVHRGYKDIDTPSLGLPTNGDSSNALGIPDFSTVSLGDSGVADLTFPAVIFDGPGADFAVFENGFSNPANDSQAFLELAFVEVSSDGSNYTRFPAHSLTQNNVQIPGSGVYMYANLIDGLAGKYIGGYGTPFDLSDLPATPGLDINNITHVRVVDAIGAISGHTTTDITGRVINDPFPTGFAGGGFDLDAVGVIHHVHNASVAGVGGGRISLYPNPVSDKLMITVKDNQGEITGTLTSLTGAAIQQFTFSQSSVLDMSAYPAGIYYLTLQDNNGGKWVEKVIRQ